MQQATADYSQSQSTYYFKLMYLYRIYVNIPTRNKLTVGIYVLLNVFIYCLSVHTHTTWLRKWLCTGSSSTSQIWAGKNSVYIWLTVYTYTSEFQLKSKCQYTETRSAEAWPLLQLYYPQLSFPQGIIWCTFQKCYLFFFSLPFLKLCKSESV